MNTPLYNEYILIKTFTIKRVSGMKIRTIKYLGSNATALFLADETL
jgi:hypothetical protein